MRRHTTRIVALATRRLTAQPPPQWTNPSTAEDTLKKREQAAERDYFRRLEMEQLAKISKKTEKGEDIISPPHHKTPSHSTDSTSSSTTSSSSSSFATGAAMGDGGARQNINIDAPASTDVPLERMNERQAGMGIMADESVPPVGPSDFAASSNDPIPDASTRFKETLARTVEHSSNQQPLGGGAAKRHFSSSSSSSLHNSLLHHRTNTTRTSSTFTITAPFSTSSYSSPSSSSSSSFKTDKDPSSSSSSSTSKADKDALNRAATRPAHHEPIGNSNNQFPRAKSSHPDGQNFQDYHSTEAVVKRAGAEFNTSWNRSDQASGAVGQDSAAAGSMASSSTARGNSRADAADTVGKDHTRPLASAAAGGGSSSSSSSGPVGAAGAGPTSPLKNTNMVNSIPNESPRQAALNIQKDSTAQFKERSATDTDTAKTNVYPPPHASIPVHEANLKQKSGLTFLWGLLGLGTIGTMFLVMMRTRPGFRDWAVTYVPGVVHLVKAPANESADEAMARLEKENPNAVHHSTGLTEDERLRLALTIALKHPKQALEDCRQLEIDLRKEFSDTVPRKGQEEKAKWLDATLAVVDSLKGHFKAATV